MHRVLSLALFVSTMIVLPGLAPAQDIGWAAGRWKGRLENFQGKDAERVLIVEIVGATATCSWTEGFSSRRGSTKSCGITATELKLTTGGQGVVALHRSGNTLRGSFTSGGSGKSYSITMTRD